MIRYAIAASLVLSFAALPARSQEAKAKPAPKGAAPAADKPAKKPEAKAPAKPKDAPMKVTVVKVVGVASYRSADPKAKWQRLKAGQVLDELSLVRTGLGARVVLRFADYAQVTVKSATKIGIKEFRKSAKTQRVKTHVGLKYGAMRTHVDSTRAANDFSVSTPVATLSVRGTRGRTAFTGDLGHYTDSTEHRWYGLTSLGPIGLDEGEGTDGVNPPSLLARIDTNTQTGDPFGGLTWIEWLNLMFYGGGRGVFGYNGGFGGPILMFFGSSGSGWNGYENGYHVTSGGD